MIVEDTLIPTLRGDFYLSHLAAREAIVYGFAWLGDRIGFTRIQVDGTSTNVVSRRIVLDNGSSIRVERSTQLLRRNGLPASAVELGNSPNEPSVMPLYLKDGPYGYRHYRQLREDRKQAPAPCDRRGWRSVARMVAEQIRGVAIPAGYFVRHQDSDRTNCRPDNLLLEGTDKPRRKRKRVSDLLLQAREFRLPKNHRVVGQMVYGKEVAYRVHPMDADNFAAGEVFISVVNHGTT